MRGVLTTALTTAWAATRQASVRAFAEASGSPRRAQERWFAKARASLGGSAYGVARGLDRATSLEDVRRRCPVLEWDDVAPWVERVENGERGVLTTEPVLAFERTSGSTKAPKRVPYTRGLLDDFSAATGPWLDDLFRHFPGLFSTRQYWSVSPAVRPPETTPGGLPVGFDDDTAYFGPATRLAMKQLMVVPSAVARAREVNAWRDETLAHLLAAEDLGFVSVWNPSFLTLLLDAVPERWPMLAPRLSASRRLRVGRALGASGHGWAEVVWPRLALVSCWTDGWAAQDVAGLRRHLPCTPLQGKGLLATEGVVSFPLWGVPAPVAAVTSHLLEFEALDDDGRPARFVDELREGARYTPLLTTRGGLVRYRLPDVVRCVGHWRALPLLRFEGRVDKTSDLRGEKVSSVVVEAVLREVLASATVAFALLAPELEPLPHYTLFLESNGGEVERIAAALEAALSREYHYRYCRELGQLGPVEVHPVREGRARWLAELQRRGLKLGDIKPSAFDVVPGWAQRFGVAG